MRSRSTTSSRASWLVTAQRIDHRAGREKEVRILAGAGGAQLGRTASFWNHSTTSLPISGYDALQEHLKPRFVWKAAEEVSQDAQPLLRREYYYQPLRQGPTGNATQYGNLTEVREIPRVGAAWATTPLRTTYTWYYPNVSAWIIDKPSRKDLYTACSGCGGGAIVNQTFLYYDDATADGQETTPPVQGLLRREKSGLAPLWSSATYEYWVTGTKRNGNLRSATDANNRTTETVYDTAFQAYPVCVANAKGQATIRRFYGVPGSGTGQVGSTSPCYNTAGGDPAWQAGGAYAYLSGLFFGKVQAEQDANAASTVYTYDVWGQHTEVTRPGESGGPTVRTTYSNYQSASIPFKVQVEQRDNVTTGDSPNYLVSYTFYDGFGQVVQTQAESATNGEAIVASTRFTGLGRVERQDAPYGDSSEPLGTFRAPNWTSPRPGTQTAYDALGRVVRVTHPDNSAARSYYSYLNTTSYPYPMTAVIDALNHQTIRETDALGRLMSAKQYLGTYAGNPGWTDAAYAQSRYAYDAADRLVDVWDPGYNNTHIVYDALGRKMSMTDPDMGTWSYAYDLAGNLTRQTDAKNQRLCFYYDELNRLKGKTYSTGTAACPADPGSYPVS